MSPETIVEITEIVRCVYCGRPLVRKNKSDPFFKCDGHKNEEARLGFIVSSKHVRALEAKSKKA